MFRVLEAAFELISCLFAIALFAIVWVALP